MIRVFAMAAGLSLLLAGGAEAGCVTGAIAGGVIGHMAGHHGMAGAAVGCAVGHHHDAKMKRENGQASDSSTH